MTTERYGLSEEQWEKIEHLLPGRKGSVGREAINNRIFIEAVIWRYRTGSPWRDVPKRYGDWKNCHRRWSRWAKMSVWKKIFEALAINADNAYSMIDSTIVRAHQHSAGAKKKQ